MARFPLRETEIVSLAQAMIAGLTHHTDVFSAPPIPIDELRGFLNDYFTTRDAVTAAEANLRDANSHKQTALDTLTGKMKFVLRYAEHIVNDDQQLALVGWSGRREATPLQAPGQCLALEATRRSDGSVFLDWTDPSDGGKPTLYHIERRELPDGAWTNADTAIDSEITLSNQPRGKALEYRVYAENKAGKGLAGNVVEIVV
jgi:hypothetical protein